MITITLRVTECPGSILAFELDTKLEQPTEIEAQGSHLVLTSLNQAVDGILSRMGQDGWAASISGGPELTPTINHLMTKALAGELPRQFRDQGMGNEV